MKPFLAAEKPWFQRPAGQVSCKSLTRFDQTSASGSPTSGLERLGWVDTGPVSRRCLSVRKQAMRERQLLARDSDWPER